MNDLHIETCRTSMKLYIVILDLTKPNDSTDYALYNSTEHTNDLAGLIMDVSRRNGTNPNDLRMFVFESKKLWERAKLQQASRIVSKCHI